MAKNQPHLADCQLCDWSRISEDGENFAKAMAVCHVLVRHPEAYQATTGKDPEIAKHDYRDFIEAFKKEL